MVSNEFIFFVVLVLYLRNHLVYHHESLLLSRPLKVYPGSIYFNPHLNRRTVFLQRREVGLQCNVFAYVYIAV